MKVVISGGHLTPALAVIHAFRRISPKTKIVFIGREFAQVKELTRSREREEMKKLRIPFYPINAAKFHRTYFLRNFEELFRLFPSLKQAYDIFKNEKPDVFISFGGYLAVPIAIVARSLGIPVITHEQTRTAGLANQLIAHLATKIAISHDHSRKYFPKAKTVLTGNPVRPAFLELFRKKPEWLADVPINKPFVYITGGSQGSHILNKTICMLLPRLTTQMILVHQCGASVGSVTARELEEARATLPAAQQRRYVIREWVSERDVAWLFQHVDLVIARAGANTVHEIMLSKVPAIFIPLPFAHMNEQHKNALLLAESGAAVILPQQELVPKTLYETIRSCLKRGEMMQRRADELDSTVVADAADRIVVLAKELYVDTSKTTQSQSDTR